MNGVSPTSSTDSQRSGDTTRQLTVIGTSSAGFSRKSTNLHDIQLDPETLASIPGTSEGGFVKITAAHDDLPLDFYGRVEARDDRFESDIERDEIGVGVHCRKGLAVEIGDTVAVEPVGFESNSYPRRALNRALKFRPASCRVRKSVSPDSGYRVCRLSREVKDLLGIEWGDRIVVQSANGRIRGMKALPLREELQAKFERREVESGYPPPFPETDPAGDAGITVDLPRIHISASAREDLGLRGDGVYQPVKVHRDTSDVFVRLLHDITIPIVLGAVTIIVGFEIDLWTKVIILCIALIVALLSIGLHARRVLLE